MRMYSQTLTHTYTAHAETSSKESDLSLTHLLCPANAWFEVIVYELPA